MSINLRLEIDNISYPLWQTPTYVTNMCLVNSEGISKARKGKSALRSIRIYCEWVRSTLNGVIEADQREEHEARRQTAMEHLRELLKAVKGALDSNRVVEVYGL